MAVRGAGTLTVDAPATGRLPSQPGLWPATSLGTNLALTLLGCMLLWFTHHLPVEFDHFVFGYSETSLCALVCFFGATILVSRQPVDRWTLPIILTFAVLCRLALLPSEPFLSTDIYRYVWDGMVQHHGINPYRYVPGDPALKFMREDEIFPSINRRDTAPTIYPPGAQIFYFLVTTVSASLTMMKLAMDAVEAVTVFALLRMLGMLHMRRELVLLYAWSPLLIWEIGSSGHVDAYVTALVALALLFRMQNRPIATGLALAGAVLAKFYPLLLLPALWRRGDRKMPLTVLAVIVCGYLPYLSVGKRVLGYAGGYADEEGMNSGSRYFLLELAHHVPGLSSLPMAVFYAFCVLCFGALLFWCWRWSDRSRADFLQPAGALAFALMLLFSPHYPWYVIWLVPFLILRPSLPMGVYVCGMFYGLTTQWAEPGAKMYFLQKWIYGVTALAFVVELVYLRWIKPVLPIDAIFPRTEEQKA
jgi:alpha-1,6-mannosyltransferase